MDNILPTSFSEEPTTPNRNGNAAALIGEGDSRSPYEAWSDSIVGDPAWYSADTIAHQTSILEQELNALLAEQAASREPDGLLPGFESLTWNDLEQAARAGRPAGCPHWCQDVDTAGHADGHDLDPEPDTSEHRGVQHTIRIARGGGSFGYEGNDVAVSLHLEQDRGQTNAPVIVLELEANGLEHHTYLGSGEAHTLRDTLARLLTDAGQH